MSVSPSPSTQAVDLVVVGGGITGCGVARDAAARGFSVTLLERHDLACGTSSRSTKLLHGGLRYLEHGHIGLVREALREREITARLAPALATPLRFVVPVWSGTSPGRWRARIGVGLYDLLAADRVLPRGGGVSRAEIAAIAPALRPGCTGGIAFFDRQTDDARLTLAVGRDAVARGATLRLGVAVVSIERRDGGYRVTGRGDDAGATVIDARCVINATGPSADRVRQLAGHDDPMLRASRGAHLVLEGLRIRDALLLPGESQGHRLFAIPWRGVVLFGTTDVEESCDPLRDEPAADDLRLLFHEARRHFPHAGLTRRNVISAFTGARPLVRAQGRTLALSREHVVRDEDGLVTIAGGKLTTWRTMAIDAVDAALPHLGRTVSSPESLLTTPLPGGAIARPRLDDVLTDEMPRHAEDVVFRRLPIGHDPREVRRALDDVVSRMAERFGWSVDRARSEHDAVIARLDAGAAALDDALGPEAAS